MRFPRENDFLEEFGISPIEVDPGLALIRFLVKSNDGNVELDFSFSAVMESFQVVWRFANRDMMVISSEKVSAIEMIRDDSGAGIRVVFDVCESISEARVNIEPDISCRWWTLRSS
ncbi:MULTISPECIES: hypothetical protein [unclassified Pseudomonas]|uniref:hypothetical protein n=1 Tax=unclassified Pseudomonas TaxID=196821 RepID=UPI0035BFB8E8